MPTGARRSRAAPRGDGEYRIAPVGILRCPICSSGMFRSWQCAPAQLATADLHTAPDHSAAPTGCLLEKFCTTRADLAANQHDTSLS
jgi:hypothetical protein